MLISDELLMPGQAAFGAVSMGILRVVSVVPMELLKPFRPLSEPKTIFL